MKMRSKLHLISNFTQASRESSRNPLTLLFEALRLKIGDNQLMISEYFDFKLYLNDQTFAEKKEFGGKVIQKVLEEILIDECSKIICHDKVSMYTLMKGYGFPIPELRACYNSMRPESLTVLKNETELVSYLSDSKNLPMYVKKSFGCYGQGNALIEACDGERIFFGNGLSEDLKSYIQRLNKECSFGWIFQTPLVSHSRIIELTGSNKISGLRIHSFLTSDAVAIPCVIFKVNIGTSDTDNFEGGRSGNLAAAVDITTGKVIRAVSGFGLNQKLHVTHPTTNQKLIGFEIPYWQEVLALVTNLQKAYPGIICPGWDIAICEDGPVVIEINTFGDLPLPQHAYRRGFLNDQFKLLMKEKQLWELVKNNNPTSKSLATGRSGSRTHHWKW